MKLNKFIIKLQKLFIPTSKYSSFLKSQGMSIGEGCEIYKDVNFGSEPYLISIGDCVRINSGVTFVTHDGGCWILRNLDQYNNYADFSRADYFGLIRIERNVHIGTNAIIMPNVTIGANSIVACGAVVTKNIPPNTIVGGIPAKKIESLDEYAQKMANKFVSTKEMQPEEKEKFLRNYFNI